MLWCSGAVVAVHLLLAGELERIQWNHAEFVRRSRRIARQLLLNSPRLPGLPLPVRRARSHLASLLRQLVLEGHHDRPQVGQPQSQPAVSQHCGGDGDVVVGEFRRGRGLLEREEGDGQQPAGDGVARVRQMPPGQQAVMDAVDLATHEGQNGCDQRAAQVQQLHAEGGEVPLQLHGQLQVGGRAVGGADVCGQAGVVGRRSWSRSRALAQRTVRACICNLYINDTKTRSQSCIQIRGPQAPT